MNANKTDAEDSQEIIERLPTIPVSELKTGDVILTASAMGSDPTRLRAINVLAGIDGIISALQRAGAMNGAPTIDGAAARCPGCHRTAVS